jgi:hypothetical protein
MTKKMLKRYYEKYKQMYDAGKFETVLTVYKTPSYRKINIWEHLLDHCLKAKTSTPIVLAHSPHFFTAGYVHSAADTNHTNYTRFVLKTAYCEHVLELDAEEASFWRTK